MKEANFYTSHRKSGKSDSDNYILSTSKESLFPKALGDLALRAGSVSFQLFKLIRAVAQIILSRS